MGSKLPYSMQFQVVVVGAGHGGIEAALAAARLGVSTACVTLSLDRIGHLPCNCSIGGPAKGHLAREVDALGGAMAEAADHTMTHIRRVATGKGPAVQTVRVQVCKRAYPLFMRRRLELQPGLTVIEGTVENLVVRAGRIRGVHVDGRLLCCDAVVLTTGTFMNALCHEGDIKTVAARHGDPTTTGLSRALADLGIRTKRFKTGTTPRLDRRSIDFAKTLTMPSELDAEPLSFSSDALPSGRPMLPTWQTRTTPGLHDLLRRNLHKSALFGGHIEGVGPRYCPSIEDKVVRFEGKESHPVFLEQEEWDGDSIYVQGFSSSMPAEVQAASLRMIPGLERCDMLRPGYAVEYDVADPTQLTRALMSHTIDGLFLAGQVNGTSGYEEAAGQGLIAGWNAARFAQGKGPRELQRDEALIGVMVDDLVTRGVDDPYRMLTARAEHRLMLRSDNADRRLTPIAAKDGLVCDARLERLERKEREIARLRAELDRRTLSEADNPALQAAGHPPVPTRVPWFELLRRQGASLDTLQELAKTLGEPLELPTSAAARRQVELEALYDGYLKRQAGEIELARRMEALHIPTEWNYECLPGLSKETIEKLTRVRPSTVGQAARVPGVRQADIALLIGHLRRNRSHDVPSALP